MSSKEMPASLHVATKKGDGHITLILSGTLDEDSRLENLRVPPASVIVIDTEKLSSINSLGGRSWLKWIGPLGASAKIKFINCSRIFIDYANLIDGFVPQSGTVESFQVPYFCENCQCLTSQTLKASDCKGDLNKIAQHVPCSQCGKAAEIDVVYPNYFQFLTRAV